MLFNGSQLAASVSLDDLKEMQTSLGRRPTRKREEGMYIYLKKYLKKNNKEAGPGS